MEESSVNKEENGKKRKESWSNHSSWATINITTWVFSGLFVTGV